MANLDNQVRYAVEVRTARTSDAQALAELGATTFRETYRVLFQSEDLEPRVAQKYSPDLQAAELADPSIALFVAEIKGALIGFAKLSWRSAPESVQGRNSIQLERIYVRESHVGQGIGARLLSLALNHGRDTGADSIWLGVMDGNSRAIQFYVSKGFQPVGYDPFTISSVQYQDIIMEKKV